MFVYQPLKYNLCGNLIIKRDDFAHIHTTEFSIQGILACEELKPALVPQF